jgi:hypothetical protein
MATMSDRKVNKPRLTLRKVRLGRELHPMYRGIVPFLLSFGVDEELLEELSPEAILSMFASFMNRGGENDYSLGRVQTAAFKRYLKAQGIEDWTNGQKARKATTRIARG